MSDQLEAEAEATPSFTIEGEEPAQSQTTEDTATSTDQEPEQKPDAADEKEKVISRLAVGERKARKENDELKQRLADLEAQTAPKAPTVGEVPKWDQFDTDEEYQVAVEDYANRKVELKAYEIEQDNVRKAQEQALYQQQQEQQDEFNKVAQVYTDRATSLGVKAEELQQASNVINAYGLKNEVVAAILNDESGPLMTKYLAANPTAIDALNNTTWLNGQEVFTQVKEAAQALQPKVSSDAPPPPDLVKGGSVPEDDNPWGATIE